MSWRAVAVTVGFGLGALLGLALLIVMQAVAPDAFRPYWERGRACRG